MKAGRVDELNFTNVSTNAGAGIVVQTGGEIGGIKLKNLVDNSTAPALVPANPGTKVSIQGATVGHLSPVPLAAVSGTDTLTERNGFSPQHQFPFTRLPRTPRIFRQPWRSLAGRRYAHFPRIRKPVANGLSAYGKMDGTGKPVPRLWLEILYRFS